MYLSRSLVTIDASKDGIKFSCTGDIGNGSVTLRQHTNVENEKENVEIELTEPVALTFSLKYLVNFCKAAGLSSQVTICLSNEVPLLVSYQLTGAGSNLRFYLAPKVTPRHSLEVRPYFWKMRLTGATRLVTTSKGSANTNQR